MSDVLQIGSTELAMTIYLAWSDHVRPRSEPVVPWDYLAPEQRRAWKEVAEIVGFKLADAFACSEKHWP